MRVLDVTLRSLYISFFFFFFFRGETFNISKQFDKCLTNIILVIKRAYYNRLFPPISSPPDHLLIVILILNQPAGALQRGNDVDILDQPDSGQGELKQDSWSRFDELIVSKDSLFCLQIFRCIAISNGLCHGLISLCGRQGDLVF